MSYKLIAADIDGTLLNTKGELAGRTIKAVREAVRRGVVFVLSTGRPYQGITSFIDALGLYDMPYILYNGAMVIADGREIYSLTIDPRDAIDTVSEGHARKSTMICWCKGGLYAERPSEKVEFYKCISGVEPVYLSSLSSLADKGITKFVWYDGKDKTLQNYAELSAVFRGRLNVHPSRPDFLEFVNANCSKATALERVLSELKIKREESVAIGDGFNDVPMLEYAGLGVAMKNADERVKAKADLVTESNDEDGVAVFVERYILNR